MLIKLEKVTNTRDLGGIKSKYGVVKYNKLLRSGHLGVATYADCEVLTAKHNLRRIIDLRTDT